MTSLGAWPIVGLLWWLAAVAVVLPFGRRSQPWLRWLRPTVGLPLALGAMVEATRSRRARLSGHPYRGFAPFLWAFVLAEAIALAVTILLKALV